MAELDPSFAKRWHQHDTFTLSGFEPEEKWCSHARQYAEWVQQICKDGLANPDPVSLNQLKVRITDRYMDLRHAVPLSHRNRIGEQGHICIFQVFERTYQKLRLVELMLTPPPLFIPAPAPPPPSPPAILGITFGELVDGEEAVTA